VDHNRARGREGDGAVERGGQTGIFFFGEH
jgi:hypothetical protein